MSAIAKPITFTPNSDAGAVSATVNAEFIKDISKTDVPARTENGKPRYEININILATDGQIKNVTWKYQTVANAEATRNADYDALVALVGTSL
ncbi:MAG: hypothetical protein ACTSQZ_05020 [Candidatus Thorarchaeota archaeon]